jgi:hypothetical protein
MKFTVTKQLNPIDEEDSIITLELELDLLESNYQLPKWAYLSSEWSYYITRKVYINRELRKLKEKL